MENQRKQPSISNAGRSGEIEIKGKAVQFRVSVSSVDSSAVSINLAAKAEDLSVTDKEALIDHCMSLINNAFS